MSITIKSSAFKDGEMIPSKYTCDGINISPKLSFSDIPAGTQSLAVINDDPDAPGGDWVHWILYNIPPDCREIKENVLSEKDLPAGTLQGLNDFRRTSYGGPCPPMGTHRYYFKIYALDVVLSLKSGATKAQLLEAMKGHILAQGQMIGKYKRAR